MTEEPLRTGSFLAYQAAIFIIVFLWTLIAFEVAQYQLPLLYANPLSWVAWSVFIIISLTPAITAITWRMKSLARFSEPDWDFREREITLSEYDNMVKEYVGQYRNYLSIIDTPLLLAACAISISAVIIPLLLMRTTILLIAAAPVVFGFLVLLFGLVWSSLMFRYIPNDASKFFIIIPAKSLHQTIVMMQHTPGISWTGVSVTLGEASGYFIFRDVSVVSRIEVIESVAKIQGIVDEFGRVSKLVSTLALEGATVPRVIDEFSGEINLKVLTMMVSKTLQEYIAKKGANEFIEEVLEEVILFLKQIDNEPTSQLS